MVRAKWRTIQKKNTPACGACRGGWVVWPVKGRRWLGPPVADRVWRAMPGDLVCMAG